MIPETPIQLSNYKTLNGPEYFPKHGKAAKKAIIILHGVGADGENLMGIVPHLADSLPDTYFIAPNGPEQYQDGSISVNGSYGFQWFSLWDRSYDQLKKGVENASNILKDFIDEVKNRLEIEYTDITLIGFSQGCMTALHTALRMDQNKQLAGMLGYSGGMIANQLEAKEISSKPPICLIHGEADPVVPFDRSLYAEEALRDLGIDIAAHIIPGLPHSIDYNGIEIGKNFLQNISEG